MTPERWKQVDRLFNEALDLPEERRMAWLERACDGDAALMAEVESLLANDMQAKTGFVGDKVQKAAAEVAADKARAPRRAGPYRLIEEIGRGGMGAVYLAERDDDQYRKRVAVKLVRPGMDTESLLSRFRRERQVLAQLDHPNIARLLDGGSTEEGVPYIVMEYIVGVPLTGYCAARELGIRERLRLFLQVCAAVAYAHRQFVVHRDIKPGNILIDETGTPKLLDFGISKLLFSGESEFTLTATQGIGLMTPDYASPEQVRGEAITIASDIYSLGAVLYELLTGNQPHRIEKLTPVSVERAICQVEPVRPSAAAPAPLARKLAGDLDNIVLRAMQKDPARRYESVEQFAEDIRRHLHHLPVRARPDTVWYRTRKFLERHRGVAAAVLAVVAALSAGAVVAWREARAARENFQLARRLANHFVFDVHDAVRDLPGSTRARELIVRLGLEYLDGLARRTRGDLALERELASAYMRIGEVQGHVLSANLGNPQAAAESYRKALRLLDGVTRRNPRDIEAHLERLAVLKRFLELTADREGPKAAAAGYRDAIREAEALLERNGGNPALRRQVAEFHLSAGRAQRNLNDAPSALAGSRRALELLEPMLQKAGASQEVRTAAGSAYLNHGMSLSRLGRLEETLACYRKSRDIFTALAAEDPANTGYRRELMLVYGHIGDALGNPAFDNLGDKQGAMEAYREMLAAARYLAGADASDRRAQSDYGIALMRMAGGMPDSMAREKYAFYRQARDTLRAADRATPGGIGNRINLAYVEYQMGEFAPAAAKEAHYRAAAALAESLLESRSTSAVGTLVLASRRLGEIAARRGQMEEALAWGRKALAAAEQPPHKARAMSAMGAICAAGGRRAEAVEWYRKAIALWREMDGKPGFPHRDRQDYKEAGEALARLLPR